MKLINQNDYPDTIYLTKLSMENVNHNTTIKNSGCGICSAMMVIHYFYGEDAFSMDEAIQLAYDCKANLRVGTKYNVYSKALAEKFNLRVECCSTKEALYQCLDNGGTAVVNVGGDHDDHIGVFSHGGHYINVIAHDKDKLTIYDTGIDSEKYSEESRKDKVTVIDNIVYCDVQILLDDIVNRMPNPIYCFYKGN